jgi:hypothetical protein
MSDIDTGNVTALRPSPAMGEGSSRAKDVTAALRAKRYRGNKRQQTVTATKIRPPKKHREVKSSVTVAPRNGAIDVAAYVAAVTLATAAAWFSVHGMVTLFPGAPMSVVGMAITMEVAKLVTAGWLARRWRVTAWIWRSVLVALIIGLAIINAAGVYAQLVAVHVGERGAAVAGLETQDAALAARIEVAAHTVADLDRRLGQIDVAIEEAAKAGQNQHCLSGNRRAAPRPCGARG